MKKALIIIAIILLYSCSNSENSSNTNTDDILLKKVITHNLGTVYETVFSYNGKKLLEEKSYRQRKVFTYDGDRIVKIEWYQNPDTENVLLQYVDFEYFSDGKLKKFQVFLEYNYSVTFTYNTDDTVDFAYLNTTSSATATGKLTIQGNEITKYQNITGGAATSCMYYYDNKNHPLKNVTGYDKLVLYSYFFPDMHSSGYSTNFGCMQNYVSYAFLSDPTNVQLANIYEYNSQNFPININKDDPNVADFLFYE